MKKSLLIFVLLAFAGISFGQWQQTNGPTNRKITCLAVTGNQIFAGTALEVFMTSDNGSNWTATGLPSDTIGALAIKGTDVLAGYGGHCCDYAGAFYGHTVHLEILSNYLLGWQAQTGNLTNIVALAVNGNNIFTVAGGGVYLSTNNGSSWISVNSGLPDGALYKLANNGGNIFLGTADGVYLSTNNGTSWGAINTGIPTNTEVFSFAVYGTKIFAGTGNGIYYSSNNGNNWAAVNNGLPANTIVNALAFSGSNIFAGTGSGVYLSTSSGNQWHVVNTGLSNLIINAFAVIGDTLFAGTQVAGVWKRSISSMVLELGIKENDNNKNITIYPNPANDQITIETTQQAKIEISNLQGQLIKTLSSTGDKTNIAVSALRCGVYVVKVKTSKEIWTKKFIKQ
jgi:photosystem II stability/assembly factor-like uncharacterized protein